MSKKVFKVCVFGPESTGKSTLVKNLSKHFNEPFVPEYAEEFIKGQNGELNYEDLLTIAKKQIEIEGKAEKEADRFLFCDSDLITTSIWSHVLFNKCDPWILEQADKREYDLYLLLDVDVSWQNDTHRYLEDNRKDFFTLCEETLKLKNRPYVIISGSWEERLATAVNSLYRLVS